MHKQLKWAAGLALGLGLLAAHAEPPPGTTNQIPYNAGSFVWGAVPNVNSGVLVTNGSGVPSISTTLPSGLTIPGYISTYPGAGLVQSTGSAWGTSITPGTGIAAALAGNVSGSSNSILETNGSGASLTGLLWSQIGSTPTTLSGYGIVSPLPVAQGGTAASSASGTALDNITGFSSTGLIDRTGAGAYSFTTPGAGVLTALGNATNASGGVVTSPVANANLANSSTTVNSQSCALGGTCTVTVSIGSGVTGLGSGVATALADAVGASGAFLVGSTSNTGTGVTLLTSTNTGASNLIETGNAGTVSNAATVAGFEAILTAGTNAYVYMNMLGGASPQGVISTGTGATGGLAISGGGGTLSIASPTVTGSFTATGLVTNADLANSTITLGSSTLTLGGTTTSISGLTLPSPTFSGTVAGAGTIPNTVLVNSTITLGSSTLTLGGTTTSVSGLTLASPALSGTVTGTGTIPLSILASQSANTVVGALTATNPSALSVPSCSGSTNALIWTSGTGFGCNTITGGTGTVTTTSSPANGNLTQFSGATSITNGNLSGDCTTSNTLSVTCSKIGGVAVSLGGAFTMSGAFTFTGTVTANTTVTFPTSGTLLTTTGSGASLTGITYSQLPTLSANQLLGALTATTPSGQSVPSCSAAGNALNWTSGTGFGCATGYLTANQTITLSGDISGSGTTAITTTLATVNSNTGAFGSATSCPTITLNGKGLATAASATTCTPAIGSVTGLGANVATALGVAVGSAGAVVTNGGALGTPSSGTATNLTGTAAGLTAGIANAIASATTTVNTSAATAPTLGKVLTATSGTTATWQTPADGGGAALSLLYNAWASVGSQIVRLANLGDSILTCNQQAPCTYGPQRIGSTFALFLIDELAQRFPQYSTGYRVVERLANGSTTVSAGDGYTLTSGTATNSTLLGPQQSGVSLNGGSLFTFSSGAVLTIAVGQPYSSVNIACVQGTGISGYTVTINGSSVGTACGSGSGASTAVIQNFANPVAFASQPATGSTLTLTALGATNYLYAYEGVLFCGAANTACTSGFAVDNWGVGGASSPWFASGTKSGSTDGGMVWVKAASGQLAMCVLENGENDANSGSGITSTQQNAQNQIVATDCQTKNASVFFFVPPPYNSGGSPATYAALQQGSLTYCAAQGWACLNMADIFMGDQSGTLSSVFPFSAQDTGMGLTPPWGTAQGLITNSDNQHLTDCGELLITQQFMSIVFKVNYPYPLTQACSQNPQKSAISSAYTNATTGFTIIQGATANTGQLEFVAPVGEAFTSTCTGYMTVGTTGVVSFELVGSAAISNVNITLQYQTAANSVYTFTSATALASALATSSITAASNLQWVMTINGVNSSTANSFAVEAHEASGTLTVPAGASCLTQMNGPQ